MVEKKNIVLSGGGIKGISLVGALYALEKLDILREIVNFAGASVGSLIIGLLVIGYSPLELYEFIKVFDFTEAKGIDINNIQNFGLDTGSKIQYIIKRLITNKSHSENITLQELYDFTKKHITFTTVCVNTMKVCYISHENYPHLELVKAIMMSLAIPLIFCPVIHENNMYIDGGCLDNFPICVFKNDMKSTFGILIMDPIERIEIDNFETYLIRVVKCIANGSYKNKLNKYKNIIEINAEIINSVDFDIDDKMKDNLFLIGYDAVVNNLDKLI